MLLMLVFFWLRLQRIEIRQSLFLENYYHNLTLNKNNMKDRGRWEKSKTNKYRTCKCPVNWENPIIK